MSRAELLKVTKQVARSQRILRRNRLRAVFGHPFYAVLVMAPWIPVMLGLFAMLTDSGSDDGESYGRTSFVVTAGAEGIAVDSPCYIRASRRADEDICRVAFLCNEEYLYQGISDCRREGTKMLFVNSDNEPHGPGFVLSEHAGIGVFETEHGPVRLRSPSPE